jgi:cyanobactin maturation PatA/PatG family protease
MDVRSIDGLGPLHAETLGDSRVCIAVLDGPVDLAHPCFAGAELRSLPTLFASEAGAGRMSAHGTHVASLLFGQPDSPVEGIAPRCRGLIAPVFRDEERLSQLDLARAIEQVVAEGADIINISGGERSATGEAQALLDRALQSCADNNVLVVAAVGNDGCACLQVPAAVRSVLAVGALGSDGHPLEVSNWGEDYRSNGIVAPGQGIVGAAVGGGTARLTGSSFATPIVSGVAALLASAQLHTRDASDPRGIGAAIVAAATPCHPDGDPRCRRYLAGRLNVPGAFDLVVKGGDTAVDSPDHVPASTEPLPPGVDAGPGHAVEGVAAASIEQPADMPAASPGRGSPCACEQASGAQAAERPDVGAAPTSPPAPAASAVRAPARPGSVSGRGWSEVRPASECGCGSSGDLPLVYALGKVGFDFRSEAIRDGFRQQMVGFTAGRTEPDEQNPDGVPIVEQPNPYNPRHLQRYLAQNPWASDKLTWTLTLDETPIYALEAETPVGMTWEPFVSPDAEKSLEQTAGYPDQLSQMLAGFAAAPPVSYVYKLFRDAIVGQAREVDHPDFVSRVSIPGVLTNRSVRLFSGQVVPVVQVKARGLYTWNEAALVTAVADQVEETMQAEERMREAAGSPNRGQLEMNIRAFLDKIYYQFRNLGQSPADRALNYTGTNAFLFGNEIRQGFLSGAYVPGPNTGLFTLDTIAVSRSPYCRMDSDCWDVVLTFFDPQDERRARVSWLFTVDVSAELPVSLAPAHRFLGRL